MSEHRGDPWDDGADDRAGDASGRGTLATAAAATAATASWVNRQRPVRVWGSLSEARGSVIIKGIAYSAFFSIFPIVALTFVGFGVFLGSQPELRADLVQSIEEYLDENVPGLLATDGEAGIVSPERLVDRAVDDSVLTTTGVVSLLVLVWSALGWVSSLRLGIRAAMHLPIADFHPVWAKVRDGLVALLIGAAVVVSAIASVTVQTVTESLVQALGMGSATATTLLVRAVLVVVVAALDTVLFFLQFRVLAAAELPRRHLWTGAAVSAVLFGLLKLSAGVVLGTVSGGGVVVASASVLALLLWMSLVARITLLGAAWAGLSAEDEAEAAARARAEQEAAEAPAHVAADGAHRGPSGRAEDRVVLAAGLVLGATAAVGARALASAAATSGRLVARTVTGRDGGDAS